MTSRIEEYKSIVAIATPRNRRNSEASLVVLREGCYLLAYSSFSTSPRDDSDAMVVTIRSHDYGVSWSDPEPIAVKPRGLNVMSPSLLIFSDGSLAMAVIAKVSISHSAMVWKRSWDEGRTWSPDRIIYDTGESTAALNDTLVLLHSGRILLPLYERLPGQEPWGEGTQMRAFCIYSDDMGESWQRSEGWTTFTGVGACEPSVYEKSHGHLVMHARSSQGRLLQCESMDNGITWSEAMVSEFEIPYAPSAIKRRPGTAEIFMVRNPKWRPEVLGGGPRLPLALTISKDQGDNWTEHPRLLESDYAFTFSYPSIAFDRQYLLLTYYQTRFRVSLSDHPDLNISLCFRRIPFSHLGIADAASE